MFNLIYKLKKLEGGTGLVSKELEKTYPGLFRSFCDHDDIPQENRIWTLQNPYMFDSPMIFRKSDHALIRDQFVRYFIGKSMSNGFSYMRRHREKYRYFMPTIYSVQFGKSDEPSIGYYARDCRIQSNMAFSNMCKSLPNGTKVVTMGTVEMINDKIPRNVEWVHTYDRDLFWKSCSHYFYYRCSDIEDPLPHTLLEAIQSGHRIISPKNRMRDFEDGIDDLLSCTDFDDDFFQDRSGSPSNYLNPIIWKDFMLRISENDFKIDYSTERRNFREWISDIVL